jgi:hypothetical protein
VSEQSCPLFIRKPTLNTTAVPLASGWYFIERSSLPLVEPTEVRHGRESGMVLRKRATRACLVPLKPLRGGSNSRADLLASSLCTGPIMPRGCRPRLA